MVGVTGDTLQKLLHVQGYLDQEKAFPPKTLQQDYA